MTSPAAPPRPEEPTVPKRRNVELYLSMFAVAIAMFAYANVGYADNGKLPSGMWGYGAGLAAIAVAAHLMIRYAAPYADPLFLPLAVFLNGIGLVLIHRLDLHDQEVAVASHKHIPPSTTSNQLMFTALGIIVFAVFLLAIKDHKVLQRYAYISMVCGLVLVAIPAMLPASMSSVNGAKSWIKFAGLSVQPAEFGKLLLVSFFAAFLMAKRDALKIASRKVMGLYLPRGRDLGPIAVCWALAMLILIFETDLGVSLMFFGAFVILLYIATERTSWLVFGLTAFAAGATFIGATVPHVKVRITAWLHPFDVETTGHGTEQIAQSIYGFASGGIFGKGLGQGRPYLLGFAYKADFILVTVGEELGMVGLFALMVVYMLIVMRGFKTALLIRDNYGKLLASGLAVTFALQVFITAGGVMRVIPLTGLPMPFLAAGGSALMANWIMIAALVRLSDAARRPPPPAIPLTEEELRAMRLAAAVKTPAPVPAPAAPGEQSLPRPNPLASSPANPLGASQPPQPPQPDSSQPRLRRQYGDPMGEATMLRAAEPTQVVRRGAGDSGGSAEDDLATQAVNRADLAAQASGQHGRPELATEALDRSELPTEAFDAAASSGSNSGVFGTEPFEKSWARRDQQADNEERQAPPNEAERRYGP